MDIQEIIAKKRDGYKLTKEEINYFISKYVDGSIADYQAAALIMAIYINKIDEEEITNLTLAMANSGDVLDLSSIGNVVDKHSTGGVGDKVTLILAPIVASLGVPVAKISGRGLGFTGGTIDKLESIPGYKTDIDIKKFTDNVKEKGISLIGQTLNLAPADKKIYALRDSIACVENIGLIASSIMSKKIAAGADKIVLDVTCGSGAFMKNKTDAIKLSEMMNKIGKLANKETVCIITNMDEPLGKAVGNILEVKEAIKALNGTMEDDIKNVVIELGSYMIKLAGKGESIEDNKNKILENINNGEALKKFEELIQNQGGDISYIKDINKFEKAKYIEPVQSLKDGYVYKLNAEEIGKICMHLGAGRIKKEDSIDKSVGIILNKKVGDLVNKGEYLAYIHANSLEKLEEAKKKVLETYKIVNERTEKNQSIIEIIE